MRQSYLIRLTGVSRRDVNCRLQLGWHAIVSMGRPEGGRMPGPLPRLNLSDILQDYIVVYDGNVAHELLFEEWTTTFK